MAVADDIAALGVEITERVQNWSDLVAEGALDEAQAAETIPRLRWAIDQVVEAEAINGVPAADYPG